MRQGCQLRERVMKPEMGVAAKAARDRSKAVSGAARIIRGSASAKKPQMMRN